MKKTLALMAMMGCSVALADANLLYGINFDSKDGSAPNVATTPGATEITTTGYVNYAPNQTMTSPLTMDGSAAYHVTNSGTFKIDGGETGITGANDEVLNTADGFTMALNALNLSSQGTGWRDVTDFRIGTTVASLQWGKAESATTLNLYNICDNGLSLAGLTRDTWYNITLSFADDSVTMAAHDAAGNLVSSASKALTVTGNLTLVQGGGGLAGRGAGHIMDNFAIYDSAIDLDDAKRLVQAEVAGHGLVQSVPEPATATLSLLALAGLAARRRRH